LFSIYIDDLAKSCSSFVGSFIVLYADDILLPAATEIQLQKLLTNFKRVLDQLDMAISSKKSCCLKEEPRRVHITALFQINKSSYLENKQ